MLNFVAIHKGINTTPGTSELRRQGRKRREVNVGNNRDVHQVSMHSGRFDQKREHWPSQIGYQTIKKDSEVFHHKFLACIKLSTGCHI